MRVGAHAGAVDFHAEVVELGFGDAAFHERTRIDARRAVALDVEQVAGVLVARRAPEMVEADVVKRGRQAEGGDVAAQVAGLAVGAHHHGHRVPADHRTDAPFHLLVAGRLGFLAGREGVDDFGGRLYRTVRPRAAG